MTAGRPTGEATSSRSARSSTRWPPVAAHSTGDTAAEIAVGRPARRSSTALVHPARSPGAVRSPRAGVPGEGPGSPLAVRTRRRASTRGDRRRRRLSPQTRPATRRRPLAWLAWAGSVAATALVAARADDANQPAGRRVLRRGSHCRSALPWGPRSSTPPRPSRFAVSPDGQQLAFIATGPGSRASRVDAAAVVDRRQARRRHRGSGVVFWSPDSRSIGFVAGDTLKRLELASGAAVTICKVPDRIGLSGTWSRNGEILFATIAGDALYRVSTAGGDAAVFVKPDPSRQEVAGHVPVIPARRSSLSLPVAPSRWQQLPHAR